MRGFRPLILLLVIGAMSPPQEALAQVYWLPVSISDSALTIRTLFLTRGGVLYAATDSGLLRISDKGEPMETNGPARVYDMTEGLDGSIYAAGALGVHRSMDDGKSWTELLPPRYHDSCGDFLHFYFVEAVDDGDVFTGAMEEEGKGCKSSARVYRSTNSGEDWTRLQGDYKFPRVLLPLTNGSFLYGGDGGGLYRYYGNATWQSGPLAVFEGAISSILALGGTGSVLLVGTSANLFGWGGAGIFRSTDAGASWHQVNAGLSDLAINDLAVSADGILFAATRRGGVFRSVDNGESWQAINEGLPTLNATTLAVAEDDHVFVGTDRGLYRSMKAIGVASETVNELPEQIVLGQNYPNPFNPSTMIPFELAEPGFVSLRVYDTLGREVVRLIEEVRPAGQWEVPFNGDGLQSGVYVYRLESGSVVRSGRMTLLK